MATDAYEELREAIVAGELEPGAPLRLVELASSLEMSISPVREAIRLLETQGLAEYAPYRGARVTELKPAEMAEIYEVRAALERTAIRRAATRFDDLDRTALESSLLALEEAYENDDVLAAVRANSAFHTALAVASGSRWLQRLLSPLLEISERYAASVGQLGETREVEERGHRDIIKSLESGDPDRAEKALMKHLGVFEDMFIEQFAREHELDST
jgi:DNA-binding GntR family transcriptional regulator